LFICAIFDDVYIATVTRGLLQTYDSKLRKAVVGELRRLTNAVCICCGYVAALNEIKYVLRAKILAK
jgi:hypothetical protein